MGFWKKLLGGSASDSSMRMLPGYAALIAADEVRNLDTHTASDHLETLLRLTSQHGKLHCIELGFDGFDSDPRPIDQIPEIIAWCKRVHAEHPEFIQWLTPGALLRFLMCVIPNFSRRLPGEGVELTLDSEDMRLAIVAGSMMAYNRLQEAGVSKDGITRITQEATANVQAMLSGQHAFGRDYGVYMP